MEMENDVSPENENYNMKRKPNRKSFEVRQKQAVLSDSDDENQDEAQSYIIGEKRSIGRSQWVQCDNPECQKWRRIDYVIDVDEIAASKWVCQMNKDEKKSVCEASQETVVTEDEDDPCTTGHEAGMVLWGKVPGYPWWPCMVDQDPDIETFYWNESDDSSSDHKTSIHVTFFGKECTRAWLYPHSLRSLTGKENIKDMGTMKYRGTNFKNDVTDAFNDAKQSLKLSVEERISKYGFEVRYDGREYAGNPDDNSEEPTNGVLSARKTMKQRIKSKSGSKESKNKKHKKEISKKQKCTANKKNDKLEMCKHRGVAKLSKTQERIKKKLKGLKKLKMKDRFPQSLGLLETRNTAEIFNEVEQSPGVEQPFDDVTVPVSSPCTATFLKDPQKCNDESKSENCKENASKSCEVKSSRKSSESSEAQSTGSPVKKKTVSWQLTREEINSVPSLVKPTLIPIDEQLVSQRAEMMVKKNLNSKDMAGEDGSVENLQTEDECQKGKRGKKAEKKGQTKKQNKHSKARPAVTVEKDKVGSDHKEAESPKAVLGSKVEKSPGKSSRKVQTKKKDSCASKKQVKAAKGLSNETDMLDGREEVAKKNSDGETNTKPSSSTVFKVKKKTGTASKGAKKKEISGISGNEGAIVQVADVNRENTIVAKTFSSKVASKITDSGTENAEQDSEKEQMAQKTAKGRMKTGKKSIFAVPTKKTPNPKKTNFKQKFSSPLVSTAENNGSPAKRKIDTSSLGEGSEKGRDKSSKMKYRSTQCMTAMADEACDIGDLDMETTFRPGTTASLKAGSVSKAKVKKAKKRRVPCKESSGGTSSQDIITLKEATDIISESFLNDSSSVADDRDDGSLGSMSPSTREKNAFIRISPLLPANEDEDLSSIFKSSYRDTYSLKADSNFNNGMMDSVVPVNKTFADESDDSPEF